MHEEKPDIDITMYSNRTFQRLTVKSHAKEEPEVNITCSEKTFQGSQVTCMGMCHRMKSSTPERNFWGHSNSMRMRESQGFTPGAPGQNWEDCVPHTTQAMPWNVVMFLGNVAIDTPNCHSRGNWQWRFTQHAGIFGERGVGSFG
eukprot:1159857-Pelagomonas_calceolata.AAC.5